MTEKNNNTASTSDQTTTTTKPTTADSSPSLSRRGGTAQQDNNNNNNNKLNNRAAVHEGDAWYESLSGAFRGVAVALRKITLTAKATAAKATAATKATAAKTIAAKQVSVKQVVRAVGENRPLAFASEGAVAGETLLPRVLYYGAWTLSGTAIACDIYTKQDDAAHDRKWQTAVYWTAFHIPASLVVPAYIIHQVVHYVQHVVVEDPKGIAVRQQWPPRVRAVAPVVAALASIVPVVPAVDYVAEMIMEPTLGAYLGLQFEHHHHHAASSEEEKGHEMTSEKKQQ